MKGGVFEWPFITMFLVLFIIAGIAITIGVYFSSSIAGKPIEVRTFAEYKWANHIPSAALFYLTYNKQDWKKLTEIALSSENWGILTEEQFFTEFKKKYDLKHLRSKIHDLENDLWGEKAKHRRKHTLFIRDRKGMIISMGLPKDYVERKGFTTFPSDYPYNCYTKNMPVYSRYRNNTRIKFVLCCYDIKACDDYLTGPGRMECENDACGVSSTGCTEVLCGDNCKSYRAEECEGRKNEWVCRENKHICGNCIVEGSEDCDDGRHCADGTSCNDNGDCAEVEGDDKSCLPRNGTVDGGTCPADCKGICGNGIKEVGEECDDGNKNNTDSCLNNCKKATCGDGYVWDGEEECDDGGLCTGDDSTYCTSDSDCSEVGGTCTPRSEDGCSASCEKES